MQSILGHGYICKKVSSVKTQVQLIIVSKICNRFTDTTGILQTAINWKNKGNIEEYMSMHQHDPNANDFDIFSECLSLGYADIS